MLEVPRALRRERALTHKVIHKCRNPTNPGPIEMKDLALFAVMCVEEPRVSEVAARGTSWRSAPPSHILLRVRGAAICATGYRGA